MEYCYTKIHNHALGDQEIVESIKKIILHLDTPIESNSRTVFIDSNYGSNAIFGMIPSHVANELKNIYDRHLKLKRESFEDGKTQGKNLLKMLNDGEITTNGFESR